MLVRLVSWKNDGWERVQLVGDRSFARIDNENFKRDKYEERDNDEGKSSVAIQWLSLTLLVLLLGWFCGYCYGNPKLREFLNE